jgi:endo-1,4-beta-xylanase
VLAAAKTRSSAVATDVRGHWASRWIVDVIRAGVMDVFPNHTFQPAAVVRRSDLAQAVSRILALTGVNPSQADWNRVTMADVGVSHLGYEDISAAVAAGVLSLDAGAFHPSRPVTGREAADAIGRLERLAARTPREPVDAWR